MKIKLTENEAMRMRTWFHGLQDVHPDYLDKYDFYLALKLYAVLGDCRIPHSVLDGTKAAELRQAKP